MIYPIKLNNDIWANHRAYINSTYVSAAMLSYHDLRPAPDIDPTELVKQSMTALLNVKTYGELLKAGCSIVRACTEGTVLMRAQKPEAPVADYTLPVSAGGLGDTPLYPSNLKRMATALLSYIKLEPHAVAAHLAQGLTIGLITINYLEQLGLDPKAYLDLHCYRRDTALIPVNDYTAEEYLKIKPIEHYYHGETVNPDTAEVVGYVVINRLTGVWQYPEDADMGVKVAARATTADAIAFTNAIVKPGDLI